MNVTHTDISGEIHGVKPSKLKLKTLQKRFENKTSLSSQEFLDYLDSYAKPSASTRVRSLGIGVRTERDVENLRLIARKTAQPNAVGVTMTLSQQLSIADAINKGSFGNPLSGEVAKKIAENLGVFTDQEAQHTVAFAIKKGIFGDPLPQEVALKIAENLRVFELACAQTHIAEAISLGRFGETMPAEVAKKIAENLKDFTGYKAQFMFPVGVAIDNDGSIIVVDAGNHRIRKIDSNGEVSTNDN